MQASNGGEVMRFVSVLLLVFISMTTFSQAQDLTKVCVHGTAGTVERQEKHVTSKAYGWGLEFYMFSHGQGEAWDNWVHYTFPLPTGKIKVRELSFKYKRHPGDSYKSFGIWDIHLYEGAKKVEVLKVFQNDINVWTTPWEVTKRVKKYDVLNNFVEGGYGISMRVGPKSPVGKNCKITISQVCIAYEVVD